MAARSLPGVHSKGAFFTRGSGHNKLGGYTEIPDEYQEVVDRLAKKHRAAAKAVPAPIIRKQVDAAVRHRRRWAGAIRRCARRSPRWPSAGSSPTTCGVRGFPFGDEVEAFLGAYDKVFVVEQNRDAQLRTLLTMETSVAKEKLKSILVYGGFPLSGRHVIDGVTSHLERK